MSIPVPYPPSSPAPSPTPISSPSCSPGRVRPSMGDLQSLSYHLEQGLRPSFCVYNERVSLYMEWTPKVHACIRDKYWSTAKLSRPPNWHSCSRGLGLSYVGFSAISLGSMSSSLFRSAVSVDFSRLVLTPLLINPPSLQLDSGSSWVFIFIYFLMQSYM